VYRRQNTDSVKSSADLTTWRISQTDSPGGSTGPGAESDINDCLVDVRCRVKTEKQIPAIVIYSLFARLRMTAESKSKVKYSPMDIAVRCLTNLPHRYGNSHATQTVLPAT